MTQNKTTNLQQSSSGPFVRPVDAKTTTSLIPFVNPEDVPPEHYGAASSPYGLLIVKGWILLGVGIVCHLVQLFTSIIGLETLAERSANIFIITTGLSTVQAYAAHEQALNQIRPFLFLLATIPALVLQCSMLMSSVKQSATWQRLAARQGILHSLQEITETINFLTLFKLFGFVGDIISDGAFAGIYTNSFIILVLWMGCLIAGTLLLVPIAAQSLSDGYYLKSLEKAAAPQDAA